MSCPLLMEMVQQNTYSGWGGSAEVEWAGADGGCCLMAEVKLVYVHSASGCKNVLMSWHMVELHPGFPGGATTPKVCMLT